MEAKLKKLPTLTLSPHHKDAFAVLSSRAQTLAKAGTQSFSRAGGAEGVATPARRKAALAAKGSKVCFE